MPRLEVGPGHGGDVDRSWEIVDYAVHQEVDALPAQGAAAQDGDQVAPDSGRPEGGSQFLGLELLALQVLDHQPFVCLHDLLDHGLPKPLEVPLMLLWDWTLLEGHVVVILVNVGLAFEKVGHPGETIPVHQRQLYGDRVTLQAMPDGVDGVLEVGADPVHLVHEADPWNPVSVACRHTVSDWGCTPATASSTTIPPSNTLRLRSTSAVKSTWPGVSMMFILCSFQKQVVAAAVMVMPLSFSWGIQSMVVVPSSTPPTL